MSALNENALTLLAQESSIDATSTGNTELFVVPPGKSAIVTKVVIRCTSFTSGGKATEAVASFGANSATYDDYLNTVTYTVTASDLAQTDQAADGAEVPIYTAGDSFRIIIETASDATTEEWAVDVFGYLV